MRVLDPGHVYELACLDWPLEPITEKLRFVKREGPNYPGNVGHHEGTTLQEVLRACLDRLQYVNRQEYSDHTFMAGQLLAAAIWHLEIRAANRHKRIAPGLEEACEAPTCPKCNHVGCEGACH